MFPNVEVSFVKCCHRGQDWGGCSHSAMPVCLANGPLLKSGQEQRGWASRVAHCFEPGWIGAEPEMLDEHAIPPAMSPHGDT